MKTIRIWMVKNSITGSTGETFARVATEDQIDTKVLNLVKYINPTCKSGEFGWDFIEIFDL